MILWHTDTDTFEPGQWLKHPIAPIAVALSLDGAVLAYAVVDYSTSAQASEVGTAWIAVCRPPYFTAIGLCSPSWPYSGSVVRFDKDGCLWMNSVDKSHCPIPDYFRTAILSQNYES